MTVAYQIREARESDVPAVIALFGVLDDLHRAGAPHQFRGSSQLPRSAEFVFDLLRAPNAALFVAEAGARIVGHMAVSIESVPDRGSLVPRRYAQIQDLVVTTNMRRLGIGQALVRAAERWARTRGVDSVELIVWEFNEEARRLYERLGYATHVRRLRRVLPQDG